jgi:hypothetical protein
LFITPYFTYLILISKISNLVAWLPGKKPGSLECFSLEPEAEAEAVAGPI